MAGFEMKKWLDENVVELLHNELKIYSFIWNGDPPKEILVWLIAEKRVGPPEKLDPKCRRCGIPRSRPEKIIDCAQPGCDFTPEAVEVIGDEMRAALAAPAEFDPALWPTVVKRLLDDGFRFDFLREQQMVQLEDGLVPVFGGDGAPLFAKDGMASVRLFRKMDDGISLILQVGAKYPDGLGAAAGVKSFFGQFDTNALEVCSSFAAPFGQA